MWPRAEVVSTCNDGSYACGEHVHGKRFCEHVHARFQMAVADGGILGIAGDEQDLQIGTVCPRGIRHLPAVEPTRQADVGDEEIDAHIRAQHLKSRFTI